LWIFFRVGEGPLVDADMLSLLPPAERGPTVEAAAERVLTAQERRLVLFVSAADETEARNAAQKAFEKLSQGDLFESLQLRSELEQIEAFGKFYFPYRFQLLSAEARRLLVAGEFGAFSQKILAGYLSPLTSPGSSVLEVDPLLIFSDFLATRNSRASTNLSLEDGYLQVRDEGRVHILMQGQLAASPFSLDYQEALSARLREVREQFGKEGPGVSLLVAGVFPYAAAGAESARQEVSTVGVGSLLGILLLIVAVFRSLRPFLLAGLVIAFGCLSGFAACLAIFGEVHLLTLVFGASLVGISVDYAFHYFCAALGQGDGTPASVLSEIFPGITLGLVTSLIGFLGILFAPFPGLREMAVFSSFGLAAAWLSVVLLYPLLSKFFRPGRANALAWASAYSRWWTGQWKTSSKVALCLTVIALASGIFNMTSLDDFRILQTLNQEVQSEEQRVRDLLDRRPSSRFFLVSGRDAEELLRREEALVSTLEPLIANGEVEGFTALSSFVPSAARQMENRALIGAMLANEISPFAELEEELGLPGQFRSDYEAAFSASAANAPLTLGAFLENPLSQPLRQFWINGEKDVHSTVMLSGSPEVHTLRDIAAQLPGVHLIDRAGELSDVFSSYRDQTLLLTLASYVVVSLVLVFRYGPRGALSVMSVPLLAGLVAFGLLGYLSEPISLFNVMALLLILGIGVDYAIFFREAGAVTPATLLAVALSAFTTLLAFGLLSFSATLAVHSFGLTLLFGIATALVLSPCSALIFPPHRHEGAEGVSA